MPFDSPMRHGQPIRRNVLWLPAVLCLFVLFGHAFQSGADSRSFEDFSKTGKDLIHKNDLPAAEKVYRDALSEARRRGDRPWTAEFLRGLGELSERRQDFKDALNWYEQALAIRESLGQDSDLALLWVGSGLMKFRLGDLPAASERTERGRSLYHDLGNSEEEALAVLQLAQISERLTNFERADEAYQSAAGLYARLKIPAGIAATHVAKAQSFYRRSQYRETLREAFAAIDTVRPAKIGLPAGDALLNLSTIEGDALQTAGNVYQRLVQPVRALQYYQEALKVRQDLHDRYNAASVLTNMGPLLIGLRQGKEAAAALQEALSIRRQIGNPADIASTLNNVAELNLAQKKPEDARKIYEEVVSIRGASPATQAIALYQLGDIALDRNRIGEALEYHLRALELRRKGRNPFDVVRSLNRIAIVRERRGELPEAEAVHAQALEGFEKLTREVPDPLQLGGFRETSAQLYPHFSRVLLLEGKVEDALLIAERSRGQALSQMYGLNRANFLDSMTPAERNQWKQATATLAKATNRLRYVMEKRLPDPQHSDAYAAWTDAKTGLSKTQDRLFSRLGRLQKETGPPAAEGLLELSRKNPRTLYLEWLVVDETSTLLFSLTSGQVKGWLLAAGSTELANLSAQWRQSLIESRGRGIKLNPSNRQTQGEPGSAHRLYAATLQPVAESLESGSWDRLVAVADGPLLDAPLAALQTNTGKRLVDLLAVSSATSIRSLVAEAPRREPRAEMLVIGDPIASGQHRLVPPSGDVFEPLENARAEARSVAALFPESLVLIGTEARESDVKKRLECCSILHFATHGVLDAQDGMNSGLLLATEPEGSDEDGLLQAWEIASLHLNARLAVLSACDTARGDRRLGEGLMGLAWAFQAAGTPTVVASVWSVDDAATAKLMTVFHSALHRGARADDALREAMQQARAQTNTGSPYYWAGFSLIGRTEAIQ